MSGNYSESTFSNPITKVGRVVYNVALDLSHARFRTTRPDDQYPLVDNVVTGAVTPDHITVQPHEICLEQDQEIFRSGLSRSINDTEIMLISSLNGMKTNRRNYEYKTMDPATGRMVTKVHTDPEIRRRKVRERLRFGGVAATRSIYNPASRVANDAIFVSQFGGLCTIMNTGHDDIKAGNWVVWDLPKYEGEGTQMCGLRDKQMVITRPYSAQDVNSQTKIEYLLNRDPIVREALETYNTVVAAGGDPYKTMAALIHKVVETDVEERSRIIGRALQNAKTGETFDIQLGRYCA